MLWVLEEAQDDSSTIVAIKLSVVLNLFFFTVMAFIPSIKKTVILVVDIGTRVKRVMP